MSMFSLDIVVVICDDHGGLWWFMVGIIGIVV